MPVVETHILEGYSDADKTRLLSALTDAVRLVVPAPDDAITVMLHELAPSAYARGGETRHPAPARRDPCEIVMAYLAAMEARDLPRAETFLGPGFEMQFPGAPPMRHLSELIDWSRDRYRFVQKTHDALDVFQRGPVTVVYVRGTLQGEWPDGQPFDNVRFIDRFELTGSLITRQEVWNDLAEVRGA